jgi:HD-like signal output (HDOD) protein
MSETASDTREFTPEASPAGKMPSGFVEAAREITAKVMRHADLEHPAVALLAELGRERRASLIAARDPVVRKEAQHFREQPAKSREAAPGEGRAAYGIKPPEIDLPAAPLLYEQLVALAAAPRVSGAELEKVVGRDRGLTAALVGLVDKAFPEAQKRVTSLGGAAALLGARELLVLAAGMNVMSDFSDIPPQLTDKHAFWQHAAAAGVLAAVIAREAGFEDPQTFFLAGFLHDVGRLYLFKTKPLPAAAVLARARARQAFLSDVEPEELGYGHASCGGELFRRLGLPPRTRLTVSYHHIPELTGQIRENAVVHLADCMCHALALGLSGEYCMPPLRETAWDSLGVKPKALNRLAEHSLAILAPILAEPPEAALEAASLPFEFF